MISGTITNVDVVVLKRILAPYLEQKYFKGKEPPSWFKSDSSTTGFTIRMDSNGGDLYASLEIGRMFRKARVYALVGNQCISSCVFLLAGAVDRWIGDGAVVAIHRPFTTDAGETSFSNIQKITTKLNNDVSMYLREMNIPQSLFDDMKRVSPESIKVLTNAELTSYGLNGTDSVFQELVDNRITRAAGLTKPEYLSRKALSSKCIRDGSDRLDVFSGVNFDYVKFIELRNFCEENIIYKEAVEGYTKIIQQAEGLETCNTLANLTSEAIADSNYEKILDITAERESKCLSNTDNKSIAIFIAVRADALLNLSRYNEAGKEAERCLDFDDLPECHITIGEALLKLSREKEGRSQVALGMVLSDRKIAALKSKLKMKNTKSEIESLKAEIEYNTTLGNLANSILHRK
jgi:ATP-dependent protease ClpP protease subunit